MEDWPTKDKDMQLALRIMDEYANKQQMEAIGLFEVVVKPHEKSMNFRIASWVLALAERFHTMYGVQQGEYVIRQVVTSCLRQDEVLH